MNSNSKKKPTDEDLSKVEEPAIEYERTLNRPEMVTDKEWDEMPDVLKKLLEKGLKQCELGQTKPHEQVKAEMKARFNLKN